VHRLLREDGEVLTATRERWGDSIVGEDGADRAAIAAIVFERPEELAWLEGLLHPRVVREYLAWRDEQTAPVAVVEIPLLYETGADARFDVVVVVTAPAELRAERSDAATDERERRLIPDAEKVARSDFSYVNDGTLAALDAFVADVMVRLTQ
jgi:dephospho-CoA kinase